MADHPVSLQSQCDSCVNRCLDVGGGDGVGRGDGGGGGGDGVFL